MVGKADTMPPIPGSSTSGAGNDPGGPGPGRAKAKRIVVSKYTRHACNQCKKAKTKCEGKPVCDRCLKTGHDCVWVEDNRKALTRHHEQALRHQNGVLRAEVDALKAELSSLRIQVTSTSTSPAPITNADFATTTATANLPKHDAQNAQASLPSERVPKESPSVSKASLLFPPSSEQSDLDVYSSSSAVVRARNADAAGNRSGAGQAPAPTHTQIQTQAQSHPALHSAYPDVHMSSADPSSSSQQQQQQQTRAQGQTQRPQAAPSTSHGIPRRDPFFGEGGMGMGMDDDEYTDSDYETDGDGESSASDSDNGGLFEDSSDSNSDDNLDKALVAPNKTLFGEYDGFQLYGLTSVFRLRRRASTRTVRDVRRKRSSSSHARPPSSGGYLSSSSHFHSGGGASSGNNKDKHGRPRSRANSSGTTASGRFIVPKDKSRNSSRGRSGGEREREREHIAGKAGKGRNKGKGKGKGRTKEKKAPKEPSPVRTARHVLLIADPVEGEGEVDKGCGCQSECWNRWLPKDIPLTRKEHDVLLDRLFLFFSSWCMRIIPEYFLRDMHTFLHSPSNPPPRLTHYSPFLHNTLLAVATAFSHDPEVRKPETRARFENEAKAYIEAECSRPSVCAVQALGMLASYFSGKGQQTLGFLYFGMSARLAQALGLGADCTHLMRSGRLRAQQMWDRAWCFHMGCAQDACWSLYVGREFGIPLGSGGRMDDPFGLLDVAENVGERLDWMTWRSRSSANGLSVDGASAAALQDGEEEMESEEERNEKMGIPQCRTFTVFLWSCQLMKISRRIMDLMNRLATTDGGTEIKLLVADIDIELVAWREDLPSELKLTPSNEASALPHKLMMHLAYWWLLILLHRPFYQRQRIHTVDLSFSVGRCNLAAREILTILRLWRKTYGTVRFAPITLIQCAFSSGTIYILQALQAAMGRRPAAVAQTSALDQVQELVGILRESGQSWECALRIADTFERVVRDQRRAMEGGGTLKSRRRKRKATVTLKLQNAGDATTNAGATADSGSASAQTPEMGVPPDVHVVQSSELADRANSSLRPGSETEDIKDFILHQAGVPDAFPFFMSYNQAQPNASPLIDSPSTDNDHSFQAYANPAQGASGYSFGQQGASTAVHHARFATTTDDDSSDSQYVSADDQDHPMSNSEADAAAVDATAFNFIYNSEINMDAIMPGLGLFDPTGLGGAGGLVGINGMGFGVGMGMGVNVMGGGLPMGPGVAMNTNGNTHFAGPPVYGMQYMGYGAQHHAVATGNHGMRDANQAGMYNAYGDMDFTSDGEDRALYDMIASLNNDSQHPPHF